MLSPLACHSAIVVRQNRSRWGSRCVAAIITPSGKGNPESTTANKKGVHRTDTDVLLLGVTVRVQPFFEDLPVLRVIEVIRGRAVVLGDPPVQAVVAIG